VRWEGALGDPVIGPVIVTPGQSTQLKLVATYDPFGTVPPVFAYQLVPYAGDSDSPNDLISLNGLPPGTPVYSVLAVPPDGVVSIDVDVAYTDEQPLGIDRLVALVDDDDDGVLEPVAEAGLRAASLTVLGVGGGDATEPPAAEPRSFVSLPNPFNHSSRISFRVQGTASVAVSLGIFDLHGRLLKTIYDDAYVKPGTYAADWDGTDNHGDRLDAGVYFVRLEAGERMDSAKFVLLR
jgi:hypothetical protein